MPRKAANLPERSAVRGNGSNRTDQPPQSGRLGASPTSPATAANDRGATELGRQASEIQRYNQVVAAAELSAILMTNSRSESKPNTQQRSDPSEPESVTGIVHISHSVGDHSFDSDQGMASCIVSFQLSVSAGEGKEELFKASTDFSVIYRGLEGQDDEAIGRFIRRVARFAAYPYFRAFVSHIVSLADIRMPPLPVLKETTRN